MSASWSEKKRRLDCVEKDKECTDTHPSHVRSEMLVAVTEIEGAEDKVKEAEDKVKEAEDKVKAAEDKVKEAKAEVKEAKAEVKEAEDKVKEAEDKVKEAPNDQNRTLLNIAIANFQSASEVLTSARKNLARLLLPDEAAGVRKRKDISLEICRTWGQPLSKLPALKDLSEVLMTPLPQPIPVDEAWFNNVVAEIPLLQDVFVISEDKSAVWFSSVIGTVMQLNYFGGVSESSWQVVIDNLIMTLLGILAKNSGVALTLNRNVSDQSGMSSVGARPDFLCWLPNGMLAFKGEEKALYSDFRVACNELTIKMEEWNTVLFGALPFLLCYAFAGGKIQLFALDMQNCNKLFPVSDVIDLNASPERRSLLVRLVANCFRVLHTLAISLKDHSAKLQLGALITKHGSSKVVIHTQYVVKKAYQHSGAVLLELYKYLKKNPIPFLASPVENAKLIRNVLHVKIKPVGYFRKPHDLIEAKRAIWCVLCALQQLHSLGWVHCDIRLENIMWMPPGTDWYLMDLEYARKDGDSCPSIRQDFRPPELRGDCLGMWTSACDMWQVGRMMELLNMDWDTQCVDLMTAWVGDARNRPAAHLALNSFE